MRQRKGNPIRIGVNAGSLSSDILERFGNTPSGMVESAMEHVVILEDLGYDRIIISLKASNDKDYRSLSSDQPKG